MTRFIAPKPTLPQLIQSLGVELERCGRIKRRCKGSSVVVGILQHDINRARAALEIGEYVVIEEALTLLKGIHS